MTKLLQFLKSLLPTILSERERDEAYLAESVDIYDLERRLYEIDERALRRSAGLSVEFQRY